MHLPPSTLGDVRGGITEVLNRKLMAYDDAIGGAMLSYSNMTLRKRQGMMFNELPNILFDVSIDAMVFCPRKGCALSGTVNKVSRNHVGILVGGVFNASVSSDDMHEGLSYDSAADAWVDADAGTSLTQGSAASFTVSRIQAAGGIFNIAGTLEKTTSSGGGSNSSGSNGVAAAAGAMSPGSRKKKNKRRRSASGDDADATGSSSPSTAAAVDAGTAGAAAAPGAREGAETKKAKKAKKKKSKEKRRD